MASTSEMMPKPYRAANVSSSAPCRGRAPRASDHLLFGELTPDTAVGRAVEALIELLQERLDERGLVLLGPSSRRA